MASNETVEQVCEELRQFKDCDGEYVHEIEDLADEAEAAHNREIAVKDAEIERLRALVKELADIVDGPLCHQDCSKCPPDTRCASKRLRALVARAREVVK